MIKVSCYKCNQSRKALNKQVYFIRLNHSKYTIIMQKDSKGKWECCNGYGCDKVKR